MSIVLKDRAVIKISGEDKDNFLQGLITNNIEKLKNEKAIYACILTPQGKYLHDFFVINSGNHYLIDCNSERISDLKKKLVMYKLRSKVEITDSDYSVTASTDSESEISFLDPRDKRMGYRNIVVKPADKDDSYNEYEEKRIRLSIPDSTKDLIQDKSFPLQNNMEELNAVDFNKGCYVGQEVTARTKYRGVIRKKLYAVESNEILPEAGSPVTLDNRQIGEMRSSLKNIGIAQLEIEEVENSADKRLMTGGAIITLYDSPGY